MCLIYAVVEKVWRKKKVDNKWVEGTPIPDLLEDFLPVNQFQLYHVNILDMFG